MSNNTSNYQEYTFSKLLEQYDKILVPMIQRDYAQGRTDKKETDVRNNLLNDIFRDKNVHFDLVFGSKEKRIIDGKEMNCFIPVDGQQRLTTLFLLHLYRQKAGKTNTEFDLSKFSYDTRRAASDFCKSITSEEWAVSNDKNVSDVIKDSSWFMNYWEKDPTVEGMLNMLDAIQNKYKEKKIYPDLSKVKFFFFDLESNGLNENLYLKMNSRGKPLTAFENLKAKMEKVLPKDVEIEDKCFPNCDASPKDSFKAKWKYFMDRNWTEAFWDSANPEKYDVSIAKFIARFLAGYWAAFGQEPNKKINEKTTAENLEEINKKEKDDKNYADYIQFEPIGKVLELDNAFPALAYALTTAPKITSYWTNNAINVSDKSEYKFLTAIFTYVLFDGDKDAMRFAWNMAENYVTEYDTFVTYCKRAGEISNFKRIKKLTFYRALSSIEFVGNTSDQVKEEIAKAKQILNGAPRNDGKSWENVIIEAEKYKFFKGAIRFLFTKEKIGDNWEHFDTKWGNAQRYFNENNIVPTTNIAEHFTDDQIKFIFSRYSFNTKNWKSILLHKSILEPIHRFLLGSKNEHNSELLADIRNILGSIDTQDVWLLQDWQVCNVVLTNYSQRRTEPFNGWVFEVGNEVRKNLNKEVSQMENDFIICVPPASGKEKYEINGCVYFRGLWTDFIYNKQTKEHYFRYYGNNTICLMDDSDKNRQKLKDPTKPNTEENHYYICIDENDNKETILFKLNQLIEESSPNSSINL